MAWYDKFPFFANREATEKKIIEEFMSEVESLEKGLATPTKAIDPKSNNINPYDIANLNMLALGSEDDGSGATRNPSTVDFQTMKAMSEVPVISAIIQTRINQVAEFASPASSDQEIGFKIRLKGNTEPTPEDLEMINKITAFIMSCGDPRTNYEYNFEGFIRQLVRDSLTFDQACFEIIKDRAGNVVSFTPVDGSSIRRSKVTDDEKDKGRRDLNSETEYVQVIDGRIVAEFSTKDLCFGIRRPRSWIEVQGYGHSELEELIRVVTNILNAEQYNAANFTNGISASGIIAIKSKMSPQVFRAFRREFYAMLSGSQNAKKTPVIQLDPSENEDVKSLNFSAANKDMEFSDWMNYLIKIACAIYAIDPAELGFVYGNEGSTSSLNASGPTDRVLLSREKGLRPLIRAVQGWLNHWLINQIDSRFELVFVGIDVEDEKRKLDMDIKKLSSFMTINEIRISRGLPAIAGGDVILNKDFMDSVGIVSVKSEAPVVIDSSKESEDE